MGSLFNAVLHADGAGLKSRILFELEEGALLGAMDEILLFYRAARKYGGIMHYSVQSDTDLTEAWGEKRADTIFNCCSWTSYNAIQAFNTAKRISEACGTHGVMAHSTGDNKSTNKPWGLHLPSKSQGNVENQHEIKRCLINPDEILRSSPNRMFVLRRGIPYAVDCTTAPYYQYPAIEGRMNANRFNYKQHEQRQLEMEEED